MSDTRSPSPGPDVLDSNDLVLLILGAPASSAELQDRCNGITRLEKLAFLLEPTGWRSPFKPSRDGRVSRQRLYTQPELRAGIEQIRDRQPSAVARVPDEQRARERSLRQGNETLLADNRRLRAENQTLRDEG
ncbi:hypothetical protein DSM104299_00246 [Baekduia alba]|uniref:hypothetical protein n=1 Tax=Baekduia alba TaxID=2997333 RepID=UPI00233FD20F|nr:hypothetical protein [Baekduia alba]WCB91575.1 hypothetical protein DSM104299_00246 [Baekduia alba]